MKIFALIRHFISSKDKKEFYIYLFSLLVGLLVIIFGIMYYQTNRVAYWKKRINNINELREEVRKVISKDEQVLGQRAEVNKMLQENPDFKIDGYFTDLIAKLNLINHKTVTSVSYADRGDPEYREVLLNAKFDTMNMRQLCELLDAIEQNKRIYTKELEIIKSKKQPNTIEVNITIATLQAKPEITEAAE
jgi:hypothetical protein